MQEKLEKVVLLEANFKVYIWTKNKRKYFCISATKKIVKGSIDITPTERKAIWDVSIVQIVLELFCLGYVIDD